MAQIYEYVSNYYNETAIKCDHDLISKVNDWDLSPKMKDIVSQLHPETMKRYYGTGLCIPDHIEGMKVLDIGCGSGSLVFILSKLVGPTGHVTGVDLTPNLIALCKNHADYHCQRWGYDEDNTNFFVGNAEKLLDFEDKSFDVVVSNGVLCVIPDKASALAEVYRVLKPGGEFYLNDVYGETAAPENMKDDLNVWAQGLTGSQLIPEFVASVSKAGFTDPYLTSFGPVRIGEAYVPKLPGRRYACAGNRMFKLPPGCSRGPATVTYKGNIPREEVEFVWDCDLTFKRGEAVPVDAYLATILSNTRYKNVFDVVAASTAPTIQKLQNPFSRLDKMAGEGKTIPYIYTVV